MKRIYFALIGALLCVCSCVYEIPQLEQNPYRAIYEYTPGTAQMEVPGALTPVEDYDWITVSCSGNTATFTLRRNTTGVIRQAEFNAAGDSRKVIVFQRAHSLDGIVKTTLASQGLGSVTLNSALTTDYADDYASWGIVYSKTQKIEDGTDVPQSGIPGKVTGTVKGLEDGVDYFFWTYAQSTEGDKVYSDLLAVIPPVYYKEGEDLQTVLENAKEYAEIRVPGGITLSDQTITFSNSCKNKKISGGWNADYSEQSMDNLTVLANSNDRFGFWCAGDGDFGPLEGYAEVSYFEIKGCKGDHGSAIHACGGPVIVHHCYVHDNDGAKGVIGTREEDYSTTLTVYNCIVADNRAAAHGAAFGFGDGNSYDDQCMVTLVNNLIVGNISTKFDGYCSVFLCYNNTELIMVNNTVVGNCNYEEYGGEYPGMGLRGNVRSLFANNIIVGNKTSKNTNPAEYYAMQKFFNFGGGCGTFAYNIYEGEIKDATKATISDNKMIASGADYSSIIDANYRPVGDAINFGTLGTLSYREARDTESKSLKIENLLDTYNTDLAGNPRVTNGKVSAGCYQN